ncbi:hypothetical protein [Nonomuraea sp. NPDC050310]|uniref:hypothetical protein n=1 Tax=Nonomuraea sp. NPDC050310 TaxID=3154935 RepID=UPI0033EE4720
MRSKFLLGVAATACAALLLHSQAAAAAPPKPAKVAGQLFKAWLADDPAAAAALASPAAVKTLFAYKFRAPDTGPHCTGGVCDFRHTSVTVPGGLNGIRMIVSGSKVTRVYTSRHLTKPSAAAKWLYGAYQRGDRHAALEVASTGAVKQQFKVKYDPNSTPHQFMGCSKEPKGYVCHWYYEGGSVGMHVRGTKARGYHVSFLTYVAD